MGNLTRGSQRGFARGGTRNRRIAPLAQNPAVGGHALRFVRFCRGVGAKLVLGNHGKAGHQIHILGGTVHRDRNCLGCRGLGRGRLFGRLGRRGLVPLAFLGRSRRLGRRSRGGRGGSGGNQAVNRYRLAGHAAFRPLIQVGFHCADLPRNVAEAGHHILCGSDQGVGFLLQGRKVVLQPGRASGCTAGLRIRLFGRSRRTGRRVAVQLGGQQRPRVRRGTAAGLVLRAGQQRAFVGRNTGCQGLAFGFGQQPAGDAELYAVGIALADQGQEVVVLPRCRSGIIQAACADAEHEIQVGIIVRKVSICCRVKAVGLGIIDRNNLAAVGRAGQIERKARIFSHGGLIGQ